MEHKGRSSLREQTACSSAQLQAGLPWAPPPKRNRPEHEWGGVLRSPQDLRERGKEGADSLRGWRPPVPGDRIRLSGCWGRSARRPSILPAVVQRVRAAHAAECLRGCDPAPRGEPAFGHGGWASGRAARRQQERSAPLQAAWTWLLKQRRFLPGRIGRVRELDRRSSCDNFGAGC